MFLSQTTLLRRLLQAYQHARESSGTHSSYFQLPPQQTVVTERGPNCSWKAEWNLVSCQLTGQSVSGRRPYRAYSYVLPAFELWNLLGRERLSNATIPGNQSHCCPLKAAALSHSGDFLSISSNIKNLGNLCLCLFCCLKKNTVIRHSS